MPELLFLLTGLIMGSFFNVVIYRLPRGESIINPPSHCPNCNTRLQVIDMIPLLSYIIYQGQCRYCGEKISWQYPAVEGLTGVLYLLVYLYYGFSLKMFVYIFLFSLLIIVSGIDFKEKIIPNIITFPGIIIGLILSILTNHITFLDSLLGLLIPALLLFILEKLFPGGIGMGDVKLVAMIGSFNGFSITLIGIFIGALVGSIIFLPLLLLGKIKRKTRIPFGPLICFGSIIMILFGNHLINWYINLFI